MNPAAKESYNLILTGVVSAAQQVVDMDAEICAMVSYCDGKVNDLLHHIELDKPLSAFASYKLYLELRDVLQQRRAAKDLRSYTNMCKNISNIAKGQASRVYKKRCDD